MGKKGSWFSAVKKALRPSDSKEKKDERSHKSHSKRPWFGRQKNLDTDFSQTEATLASPAPQEARLTEAENEQSIHAYSVAYATAVAAEAAVAAAHAAAEVVRLTSASRFSGKSPEEIAAIKIQTAYRGHLARRALRAVKGLGRLKSLIQGQSVKRQATSTLRCMQTLARVQSQVRSRRMRLSEENQALQRQILQKHEKELDNIKFCLGDAWDDSIKSKEEIEASLQSKHEAALRRERALAYAYSLQQARRNSTNPTFMDPNNPHWGWSWLERWMAARPWEAQTTTNKEPAEAQTTTDKEPAEAQTTTDKEPPVSNAKKRVSRPSSRQSPARALSSGGRIRPESQNGSIDNDSRSFYSLQSDRNRRHSNAGSSVHEDASLDLSPALPSYMASTKSTKARSRMSSPSPSPSPLGSGKKGLGSGSMTGSAKKRLSFTGSPARVGLNL